MLLNRIARVLAVAFVVCVGLGCASSGGNSTQPQREVVYVPVVVGSTPDDVVRLCGEPQARQAVPPREVWTYPGATVVFDSGRVIEASKPVRVERTVQAPASGYGEISKTTGLPRTQYVNGYYRKDGTYVKPYYRSHR